MPHINSTTKEQDSNDNGLNYIDISSTTTDNNHSMTKKKKKNTTTTR